MNIIDIFYNEIIPEAKNGKIDCGFLYNVIFNTITSNESFYTENNDIDFQIPTLYISNKNLFDNLIVEYVEKAYPLYDKDYYDNEHDYIKAILVFLITNMTVEEFIDPTRYIKKRINFIENKPNNINEYIDYGESSYLGNIEVNVAGEPIFEETPYSLKFKVNDNFLPVVRFGISDETVYIYAIQNEKDSTLDKRINRTLYKINQNFDTTTESYDNINDYENLTGVSPSAVVAATLAISYFSNLGYDKINITSFLPVRYNAKVATYKHKLSRMFNKEDYSKNSIDTLLIEQEKNTYDIQRNISDKLVRTFRRLDYHFNNINISSYPFDVDSNLHLTLNDEIQCNNDFLYDLFMCKNSIKRK